MNPKKESGASAEEQKQARDVVHEFFQLLPYEEVNSFNAEKASEEELKEFKALIDEGQTLFEEIESMRIMTGSNFTAEELTDTEKYPFRLLQRIAKSNGISAGQSRAVLEAELTGIEKSLPAIGRYPNVRQRLADARKNAGGYNHPRMTAARQNRQ